jgi:hypothetical protein
MLKYNLNLQWSDSHDERHKLHNLKKTLRVENVSVVKYLRDIVNTR